MDRNEAIAFFETLEGSDQIKDPTALMEALKKAKDEAKLEREKADAAATELTAANEKLESFDKFKADAKAVAIQRELRAAGIKNADKITRLLDADKIELDESGDLTGFTEQFDLTKSDWPELFDVKRQAGPVDQFSGKQEPEPKLSATQQQLKQLRDRAGV